MRRRERGIGNMPFIALLVLFVIACALFFVKQDEASDYRKRNEELRRAKAESDDKLFTAEKAYQALYEVTGLAIPEVTHSAGQPFPPEAVIRDKVREWIMAQVGDIAQKSQAKIRPKVYTADKTVGTVKVQEGDPTTITLFGVPFVRETATLQAVIAPLGEQFRYAAKAIEDNNTLLETEYKAYQSRVSQLQTEISRAQGQYRTDVAAKQQALDTEIQQKNTLQDSVTQLTTRVDGLSGELQRVKDGAAKDKRTLDRTIQSLRDRIVNEKKRIEIALKEDPKDGEVLHADQRQGLVFINRGRNFRVVPNMKFTIWRQGKGNVREDIAEIRVIDVGDTKSTCRILKWINPRVPVAQGMSISNPFYDPFKKLRVHISGDLRYYPSDLAKRRLAESGCIVAERLDDTVDVVVLGEPPVDLGAEAATPEEAAAAEERAKAQREARIREVMETAASLGAVVVTEEVLRTFIEY